MEHFFRCRRTGKHRPLDAGMLALLADIAQRWPGRIIEVISGYRAPPFGAPHSRHFLGHAIDLRVRGVRTAKVRDYVWREHQGVGVGHYSAGRLPARRLAGRGHRLVGARGVQHAQLQAALGHAGPAARAAGRQRAGGRPWPCAEHPQPVLRTRAQRL